MLSTKFERAHRIKIISQTDWKAANRCRLYLTILSIADIVTGNGLEIDRRYWLGEVQEERARNLEWSTQGNPSINDWITWRRVLRLSIGAETPKQLSISLGAWYEMATKKE